jgi:Domain of unknown function (DUF3458_C) ARM repeats
LKVTAQSTGCCRPGTPDGSGYSVMGEAIREIDGFNPMIASRLTVARA